MFSQYGLPCTLPSRSGFVVHLGLPGAGRTANGAAGSVGAPVFTIPSGRSSFPKGLNNPCFTRARIVLIGFLPRTLLPQPCANPEHEENGPAGDADVAMLGLRRDGARRARGRLGPRAARRVHRELSPCARSSTSARPRSGRPPRSRRSWTRSPRSSPSATSGSSRRCCSGNYVLDVDPLAEESPALAGISSASIQGRIALGPRAGARVFQLGREPDAPWVTSRGPCQAHLGGFDLHANITVGADDRAGVERLCRYVLRPPVAQERLSLTPDGLVLVTLKSEWHDGTTHLLFTPVELLEKLAALTPRPRVNLVLYHGILAPRARARARAVAHGAPSPGERLPTAAEEPGPD